MALTFFQEKWRNVLIDRKTPLCAVVNIPVHRGESLDGSPVLPTYWSQNYVRVMKRCAASLLTRPAMWKSEGLHGNLMELHHTAAWDDVLSIEDMTDYGSKGICAVTDSHLRKAGALVVAPSCTGLETTIQSAHGVRMGIFITCLDHRFEDAREKDKLMTLPEKHAQYLFREDKHNHDGQACAKKHVLLAEMAYRLGADGIACCAPGGHVTEDDVKRVARYAGQDMLVLCTDDGPALKTVYKYFNRNRVLVATDKLQSQDVVGHSNINAGVLDSINTIRYAKKASTAPEDNALAAR